MEIFLSVDLRPIRKAVKSQVLAKWGHVCVYCEKKEADTFDHLIPLSRGGHTLYDNLVPACRSCNSRKGDRLPEEFQPGKWVRCQERDCPDCDAKN